MKTWSRVVVLIALAFVTVASTAGSAASLGDLRLRDLKVRDLTTSLGLLPVQTSPTWAPASSASIRPGVQTFSESGQCTANFVFHDGTDVYIGQAAHCTGMGAANETNGCDTRVLDLPTPVRVDGAQQLGQVVYNSWATMQGSGETNLDTCFGNDFALIKIAASDRPNVNPSIPFWGGPQGIEASAGALDTVYGYGNSGLRGGIEALSPKVAVHVGSSNGGWSHSVYAVTPGIPGDSGSAFLGSDGGALGVLSTLSLTLTNQVTDLSRALAYMRAHTNLDAVQLANGTEQFSALLGIL